MTKYKIIFMVNLYNFMLIYKYNPNLAIHDVFITIVVQTTTQHTLSQYKPNLTPNIKEYSILLQYNYTNKILFSFFLFLKFLFFCFWFFLIFFGKTKSKNFYFFWKWVFAPYNLVKPYTPTPYLQITPHAQRLPHVPLFCSPIRTFEKQKHEIWETWQNGCLSTTMPQIGDGQKVCSVSSLENGWTYYFIIITSLLYYSILLNYSNNSNTILNHNKI